MKVTNLNTDWRSQLGLDDKHEEMELINLYENVMREFGQSDNQIQQNREKNKLEALLITNISGKENRAFKYSLSKCMPDKFSVEERNLILFVYSRLRHLDALPKQIDKKTNLIPLLSAFAVHFDTCEAFDSAKEILKKITRAYVHAEHLLKNAVAIENILLTILPICNKDNVNDCVSFLEFLNVAHAVLLSEKALTAMNDIIRKKGITVGHDWLLHTYQLRLEIKKKSENPDKDFVDLLERAIKYAKVSDKTPFPVMGVSSPQQGITMFQGLQMLDFALKSEPTPPQNTNNKRAYSPILFSNPEPSKQKREEQEIAKIRPQSLQLK